MEMVGCSTEGLHGGRGEETQDLNFSSAGAMGCVRMSTFWWDFSVK